MEIVNDSLSKQKRICKKFAEKFDIPEADIYKKAEEEYDKCLQRVCQSEFKKLQKTNPDIKYEDCIDDIKVKSVNEAKRMALVRSRSFYKKQAGRKQEILQKGTPCFILMRFKDNDFEVKSYKKVEDFVKEEGEDRAKRLGYIDKDGNYLHSSLTTNIKDKYGDVIDKNLVKGNAIGFFEEVDQNGNETRVPRYIRMWYIKDKVIPICRPATVITSEGNSPGPMFTDKNILWYNDGEPDNDDEVICSNLAKYIVKLYGEHLDKGKFASNYKELCQISQSQIDNYDQNKYAGIMATCLSIGQRDDPEKDIPCEFEFFDEETGDIDTITIYVPVMRFKGMLIKEGQSGILFVTDMYNNKDGELKYHLGGFLPFESEEVEQ